MSFFLTQEANSVSMENRAMHGLAVHVGEGMNSGVEKRLDQT
jgi:hypothetical protein